MQKNIPVKNSKELHDPLFTASLTRGRLLYNEGMDAAVMSTNGQSSTAVDWSTQQLDLRLKTVDPDKVVAVILQQQVLSRDLHVVKLLVLEFGQVVAPVLELLAARLVVQNVLKLISPALQPRHELAKSRLVGDKVVYKRSFDLRLEQVLREPVQVCFSYSRQLLVLAAENQPLEQLLYTRKTNRETLVSQSSVKVTHPVIQIEIKVGDIIPGSYRLRGRR